MYFLHIIIFFFGITCFVNSSLEVNFCFDPGANTEYESTCKCVFIKETPSSSKKRDCVFMRKFFSNLEEIT
jgi:hypothetical protein